MTRITLLFIVSIFLMACGANNASDASTLSHQDNSATEPASNSTATSLESLDLDLAADDAAAPQTRRGVVFFGYDSAELTPVAQLALKHDIEWLIQHPDRYIVIHGYASDRGDETHNLRLGNARANVVREFFIANGVDRDRLTVVSHGESGPELPDKFEQRAVFVSDTRIP